MLHCYLDTDADMKDVYNTEFVEAILSNILSDIQLVSLHYPEISRIAPSYLKSHVR